MASKRSEWVVRNHEPLRELDENLWVLEAELSLLPIGRRMTVFRLPSGRLAVHSAVACDEPTMRQLEQYGDIELIVVPSGMHRLDAPRYKARYPDARVVTTERSSQRVGKVVAVDGLLDSVEGADSVRHEVLDGASREAVWILSSQTGATTLLFNDILMNLPSRLPGFKGWLVKVAGATGGPKVSFDVKVLFVENKRALADHLRRLAALPGLCRLIPGHGAIIETPEAPEILRGVAERLSPAPA